MTHKTLKQISAERDAVLARYLLPKPQAFITLHDTALRRDRVNVGAMVTAIMERDERIAQQQDTIDALRNAAREAKTQLQEIITTAKELDATLVQVIAERDEAQDMADRLAAAIVQLTVGGNVIDAIGKHSSAADAPCERARLAETARDIATQREEHFLAELNLRKGADAPAGGVMEEERVAKALWEEKERTGYAVQNRKLWEETTEYAREKFRRQAAAAIAALRAAQPADGVAHE